LAGDGGGGPSGRSGFFEAVFFGVDFLEELSADAAPSLPPPLCLLLDFLLDLRLERLRDTRFPFLNEPKVPFLVL
jgi:hypothetical protein